MSTEEPLALPLPVSAVTEAGKVGDPLAEDFFREEYILNNAIGACVCVCVCLCVSVCA